jgi:formylglycine-generating enzyme required for sulfatase activity
MGSPLNEEGHDTSQDFDETQHRVVLTKGFFMGIHLVTRGHFAKFALATGHTSEAEVQGGVYYQEESEWKLQAGYNWRNPGFYQTVDHPVLCVSWNDCLAFCQWLTAEDPDRRPYRLPTEAEWEYACRAGTTTIFYFGDTLSTDQANFDGTTVYGKGKKGSNRAQTTPVGAFPPNAWGLFDMHGNAGEWCQDWSGPYPAKPLIDYQGPSSGQYHLVRGGGWASEAVHCRSADRWGAGPSFRQFSIGFRICFYPD